MNPVSFKPMPSSSNLQPTILTPISIIGSIKGSVKKLGQNYQNADVVLYHKANLQPIAIRKPKENGDYSFMGLTTDIKTFVIAFDAKKQFNAVIQDQVVPK